MDSNLRALNRSRYQDPDHIFKLQLLKQRLGIVPIHLIYQKAESFAWNRTRDWGGDRTRTRIRNRNKTRTWTWTGTGARTWTGTGTGARTGTLTWNRNETRTLTMAEV